MNIRLYISALEDLKGIEPRVLTLPGFFKYVTQKYSSAPALIYHEQEVAYQELLEDAYVVASGLKQLGAGKGTRVGVLLSNSPTWVTSVYGAAMLGCIVVPISTFSSPSELAYIVTHADISFLIFQNVLAKRRYLDDLLAIFGDLFEKGYDLRAPFLRKLICVDTGYDASCFVNWNDFCRMAAAVPHDLIDSAIDQVVPGDDALILYTSGTTSFPKGVLHLQRTPCIQSIRWASELNLKQGSVAFTSFPFFWSAGFAKALGSTLWSGSTLVVQDVFDPRDAMLQIEKHRVSVMHVPVHHGAEIAEQPDFDLHDLRSVENIEPGPLAARLGLPEDHPFPSAAYGLTETFTIVSSINSSAPYELRKTTHGKALPGCEIKIFSEDGKSEVAVGEIGEIAVRGIVLMRGYYKTMPEECFDEQGYFHTGDAGYFDQQGYLHWTGRMTNMIKSGGANVSPVEIQDELAKWGVIKVSVAFGVPHPTLGEAVVLCVVPNEGIAISEEDVKNYLRGKKAAYKIPRRVFIISMDEVPVTGTDKVRFEELKKRVITYLANDSNDVEWAKFLQKVGEK
jgi:fatty-acyl-CoA synthase